jgi:hypothetical protein
MKNIFLGLNEDEKKRILEMHNKAVEKETLNEQVKRVKFNPSATVRTGNKHPRSWGKHGGSAEAYLNLDYQDGNASADYCLNTYLKRKNLGESNPELFNKPRFTLIKLPPGFYGQYSLKYNHDNFLKKIKNKKEKNSE